MLSTLILLAFALATFISLYWYVNEQKIHKRKVVQKGTRSLYIEKLIVDSKSTNLVHKEPHKLIPEPFEEEE